MMKPPRRRILFFHQSGSRGGAGTMLANVLIALDRCRFEPIVVCPKGDGNEQLIAAGATLRIAPRPLYQFLHSSGSARSILHPFFLRPALMQRLHRDYWQRYIRDSGAEIVCLNALTLAPMAAAAKLAAARVVCLVQETTVRGWLGIRTGWLYHWLSTQMDAVVFISEFDRSKARCRAPIVDVIPNWVNVEEFDRSSDQRLCRRKLGVPETGRILLMMGGIDPLKGTIELLRAVAELDDLRDLVVVIAGYAAPPRIDSSTLFGACWHRWRRRSDLEYYARVMRLVQVPTLSGRVHFIGMQNDVAPVYAAADIVVFPATQPHQARPVLEAGAMAKPVIVPDFPQLREFVQHGVNGLTYRPGDVRALAQAARLLLDDSLARRTMGENNYRNTYRLHEGRRNGARIRDIFVRVAATIDAQ